MLRFCNLASGSAGNATLVEASDGLSRTLVLIDCGLGWRQLAAALARCALTPDDIDAVFITHEHGDHVGSAPRLATRHRAALWTSAGTAEAMRAAGYEGPAQIARDGQLLSIGALQIRPFTVPHDAREPLQLRCSDGDRVLGIATDLGHATAHVMGSLHQCHALLLESNHDPDMLAASRYPEFLKRRVAGDLGHLSNAAAAALAARLNHSRLGHVLAGHLSERNNLPELAAAALAPALNRSLSDVLLADAAMGSDWLCV